MPAAVAENLGTNEYTNAGQTTTVWSGSKTIAVGNYVCVWVCLYGAAGASPTATDNLGNVYTFIEQSATAAANCNVAMLRAPVTVGGTLTTITVTHAARQYRTIIAVELSGAGSTVVAGGGTASNGSTAGTGITSKAIPADGIAVWAVGSNTNDAMSAGASSGTPATAANLVQHYGSPGNASMSIGVFYALGGTGVSGFTGQSSHASIATAGAGATFDAAPAVVPARDPMGMMGVFGA